MRKLRLRARQIFAAAGVISLGSVLAVVGPLPAQASPAGAKPPTLTPRPTLTPTATSIAPPVITTTTTTVKPPARGAAGAASASVSIIDFAFSPGSVTVHVGDTITWTNHSASGQPHSSTSDTSVWDSNILSPGQSYSRTFSTAGTFAYHCKVHPTMLATVFVNAVTTTTTTTRPGTTTTTRAGSTTTTVAGVLGTTVTTAASGLATTGAQVAPLMGIGLAALLTGLLAVSLASRRRVRDRP